MSGEYLISRSFRLLEFWNQPRVSGEYSSSPSTFSGSIWESTPRERGILNRTSMTIPPGGESTPRERGIPTNWQETMLEFSESTPRERGIL